MGRGLGDEQQEPQKRPKFAPVREDGLKAWLRESYHFGRTSYSIVYAETAAEARNMYARSHLETIRVRRATADDVAAHAVPGDE